MCRLHEMAWFYPAVSETSKLQKQWNWEGKRRMRLYVGGHEHSERQRKCIDWLGGGITTSNPVEGDERVEAEWCKDLESSEVPLLELKLAGTFRKQKHQTKLIGDRLRTLTRWKCQRTWDKGLNAEGAFSWWGQQGPARNLSKESFKIQTMCICWQRKWTQHEQLCMTSPHNSSDYESFLSAFHFLLFSFS